MSAEDHPREQDRHSTGSTETDENATDDAASESMSQDDNPFDDEMQSFKDELNNILPGKDPLMNLRVVQTGPVHYSVYSARNGQFTKHRVNIQTGACTCQDQEFNVPSDETREACAHVAACVVDHPQMTTEEQGLMKYFGLLDDAAARLDEIEDIRDTLEGDLIAARDANAGTAQTDADAAQSSPNESAGDAASEAADRLSDAFADVVDDMQVKAANGQVWFQTGKDTPEDWPFPGGDSTFDVLTGPDMVKFVHDGTADWADSPHPLYDDKPGEWWKNALDPEDVDEYISEVLS